MTFHHAVVWTDHHAAHVVRFDDADVASKKLQEHTHDTGKHKSAVRTEHEFFGSVLDEIADVPHLLIAGSHQATADFKRYVEKHKPQVAARIVAYEVVDHPSDKQLVALARAAFEKVDRTS